MVYCYSSTTKQSYVEEMLLMLKDIVKRDCLKFNLFTQFKTIFTSYLQSLCSDTIIRSCGFTKLQLIECYANYFNSDYGRVSHDWVSLWQEEG